MPRPSTSVSVEELERDLRAIREILRRPQDAEIARGRLTGPQQSAMHCLVKTNGLSLKELSHALGLAHSTVSGIVDRLTQQGLVNRREDARDGRATRIVLSPTVRKYLKETWPALTRHPLARALERASAEERRVIATGVRTLRRLLDQT